MVDIDITTAQQDRAALMEVFIQGNASAVVSSSIVLVIAGCNDLVSVVGWTRAFWMNGGEELVSSWL